MAAEVTDLHLARETRRSLEAVVEVEEGRSSSSPKSGFGPVRSPRSLLVTVGKVEINRPMDQPVESLLSKPLATGTTQMPEWVGARVRPAREAREAWAVGLAAREAAREAIQQAQVHVDRLVKLQPTDCLTTT